MAKQPAFQFYTGDWLKDPRLSMCSPATRGIWIDLLCAMHEDGRRGELTGTAEQLARVCRSSPADLSHALDELSNARAADITTGRHGLVTVTCRRMKREADERNGNKERKKRQRSRDKPRDVPEESRGCHENVTPPSSTTTSTSTSKNPPSPPEGGGDLNGLVLSSISRADLGIRSKVLEWAERNIPRLSEDLRLKVLACSVRARSVGKDPPKLFLNLVKTGLTQGLWRISAEDEQVAHRPPRKPDGKGEFE